MRVRRAHALVREHYDHFFFLFYLNYTRNLSPFLFLSTAVHMHDSNENFFVVAVSRD